MSDPLNLGGLAVLLPVGALAAYVVVALLLGPRPGTTVRALFTGAVTPIFIYAYLILRGEAPAQWSTAPLVVLLAGGFIAGWLMEQVRLRLTVRSR